MDSEVILNDARKVLLTGIKLHTAALQTLNASLAALGGSPAGNDTVIMRTMSAGPADSARMGILKVLRAYQDKPQMPKQIVSVLTEKGFAHGKKDPQSLAKNVGAVLSTMLNARKEVKRGPGGQGYLITATGMKVLEAEEVVS